MGDDISTLVAVVIGGIIAAGSSYLLDRRRERVDMQTNRRNLAIEIKRASRLIDAELSLAEAGALIMIKRRRSFSPDVQLNTNDWEMHRSSLAPLLSDEDWLAVRVAMEAVKHLALAGNILAANEISDNDSAGIEPMLKNIQSGRHALAKFTLDQPLNSLNVISHTQEKPNLRLPS